MTTQSLGQTAARLATFSIAFTLCIWGWILTRPPATFHDQGGLTITLIYFPATFVTWLLCSLPSAALAWRRSKGDSESDVGGITALPRLAFGLIALALLLSVGTLFIA